MAEKKTPRKSATGGKAATAATKKKTVKTAKKPAQSAAASKKTKTTSAKPAKKTAARPARSRGNGGWRTEEWQRQVAEAAYLRAERHGFHGDPVEHWLAAEAEIQRG